MTDSANSENERRQSFRIDMEKELIDFSWVEADGSKQQQKIECMDFSRGGLRINLDRAIAVDTKAMVVFNAEHPRSQQLTAVVIRCHLIDDGSYDIALKLA